MSALLNWVLRPKQGKLGPYVDVDFEKDDLESYRLADTAPILKLNSAILQQAVSEGADRIDFRSDLPKLDSLSVETPQAYEKRIELEKLKRYPNSRESFARMMAEAGIKSALNEKSADRHWMTVIYTFSGMPFAAIYVPPNLIEPSMRAYQYFFNYEKMASMARAENRLTVSSRERSAVATVDRYDPKSPHMLGVALDYTSQ